MLENAKRDSSFLVREGRVSVCPQRKKTFWYSAEADSVQSESGLWHLRGAEGDRLTERSEGRKLPQLEPRAFAAPGMLIILLGGAPGGVQRGPWRGAAPNRPPLPHAGQASQPRRTAKPCARRAENSKR